MRGSHMALPYLDRADAAPAVREALDALPDLNLFRMVAHAQSAFAPWLTYGGAVLSSLSLDPRLRELAVLQVAKLTGSEYEWVQHETIARGVGVEDPHIEAVRSGELDAACLGTAERVVLRFTTEVVERHGASADSVGEL